MPKSPKLSETEIQDLEIWFSGKPLVCWLPEKQPETPPPSGEGPWEYIFIEEDDAEDEPS